MQTCKRSTPVKLLALILAAVFLLLFLGLTIWGVLMADRGLFNVNDRRAVAAAQSLQETMVLNPAENMAYNDIFQLLYSGVEPEYLSSLDTPVRWVWSYKGVTLASTLEGDPPSNALTSTHSAHYDYDSATIPFFDRAHIRPTFLGDSIVVETEITTYFLPSLTKAEGSSYFSLVYHFVDWSLENRVLIVAGAIVSLVLLILLLVFLFRAAGWRKGEEAPRPNPLDRIPFDLYFLILCIPFALGLAGMFGLMDSFFSYFALSSSIPLQLLGIAGCFLLAAGSVLAFLLSMATRIKCKYLWRNTLTWRLCRLIGRGGRGLGRGVRRLHRRNSDVFSQLPMIWRGALIVAGVFILELILVALVAADFGFLLLFLLINLALAAFVIRLLWGMRQLREAGEKLAAGDMDHKVDTSRLHWDFRRHGENLNAISEGMALAVEKQMRSERMKTELITNVSHDIKTPLTSIVNYVDLLQKPHSPEEQAEYLEVLARQSGRLKRLTEDLVDASKATAGAVEVNAATRDLCELLRQAVGEYGERLEKARLDVLIQTPGNPVWARVDGRLLWRAMDNLLNNASKYAMPGTRLYCQAAVEAGQAVLRFKNISRDPLNISADELMERFVRGDSSRSTEGSGLGLNIARSLTELQGGRLLLTVDGDLFKAELHFPATAAPPPSADTPQPPAVH